MGLTRVASLEARTVYRCHIVMIGSKSRSRCVSVFIGHRQVTCDHVIMRVPGLSLMNSRMVSSELEESLDTSGLRRITRAPQSLAMHSISSWSVDTQTLRTREHGTCLTRHMSHRPRTRLTDVSRYMSHRPHTSHARLTHVSYVINLDYLIA